MSYTSTSTSFSHKNSLEGEILGSRLTRCVYLTNKKKKKKKLHCTKSCILLYSGKLQVLGLEAVRQWQIEQHCEEQDSIPTVYIINV